MEQKNYVNFKTPFSGETNQSVISSILIFILTCLSAMWYIQLAGELLTYMTALHDTLFYPVSSVFPRTCVFLIQKTPYVIRGTLIYWLKADVSSSAHGGIQNE